MRAISAAIRPRPLSVLTSNSHPRLYPDPFSAIAKNVSRIIEAHLICSNIHRITRRSSSSVDEGHSASSASRYFHERKISLSAIKADSYPVHKQQTTLKEFIDKYSEIKAGEDRDGERQQLEGRVQSRRVMGKLIFLTIAQGDEKFQIKIKSDFKVPLVYLSQSDPLISSCFFCS